MPTRPTGVTDTANAAGIVDVDVIERPALDIVATTTADPGTSGTALAVTARDRFPQSGQFKIRVEDEIMYVTAGFGTGAGSFTVTRGQDGTANVAHAIGVPIWQLVGVQRMSPTNGDRIILFSGRAMTFRTIGRGGTAGQKIFSIFNSSTAGLRVAVKSVIVDLAATVIKAVTVPPPVIRIYRVTAAPTNGSAVTKVAEDSLGASSGSVAVLQDASADGTSSGTTLTSALTTGNVFTQEYAPRLITAVGYEMADRVKFLDGEDEEIILNSNEGVVVFLEYTLATQNPSTDVWIAGAAWEEFRTA